VFIRLGDPFVKDKSVERETRHLLIRGARRRRVLFALQLALCPGHLLRPRIWPPFRASSGLACPELFAGNLATYWTSTPQVRVPVVGRWHDHLHDLV